VLYGQQLMLVAVQLKEDVKREADNIQYYPGARERQKTEVSG
jgi:hypothetical protein